MIKMKTSNTKLKWTYDKNEGTQRFDEDKFPMEMWHPEGRDVCAVTHPEGRDVTHPEGRDVCAVTR